MGAQIIKRQEGTAQEISTIGHGGAQISYNSDGHIVIRYIDGCSDTLIVLDQTTSAVLISFIQNMLKEQHLPF